MMRSNHNPASIKLHQLFHEDISELGENDLRTITASFAPVVGDIKELINNPNDPNVMNHAISILEKWEQDLENARLEDPFGTARSLGEDTYHAPPSKISSTTLTRWNKDFVTPVANTFTELSELVHSDQFDNNPLIKVLRNSAQQFSDNFQRATNFLTDYTRKHPDPEQHNTQKSDNRLLNRVMGMDEREER